MIRHLLDVDDLSGAELHAVLAAASVDKPPRVLAGQGVALLFEKPSARTRNSTEMAVVQLGGHPVTMRGEEVGFDRRETAEDIARTLACYHRVIAARVFDHRHLQRMASVGAAPVVNLLSDQAHPLQAVADLLTLRDRFGRLEGLTVAWIGDCNNVARSLGLALAAVGARLRVASPPGYGPGDELRARWDRAGLDATVTSSPQEAVDAVDAVCTDTWTSMGQEDEADARRRDFAGFTVDEQLLRGARADVAFLHCLPAHRGEEVADAVLDGPASLVWAEAANRLHAARGVLLWLLAS